MAKTKTGGRARQGTPRKGRRLGIKVFGSQPVEAGQIIVRQVGSSFHSGQGTGRGRDFTVYSLRKGVVNFRTLKGKKMVEVV